MQWITDNAGTILVCIVLIFIVAGIIRSLIKDKKRGKSSCGNNCAHCAMAGKCHNTQSSDINIKTYGQKEKKDK